MVTVMGTGRIKSWLAPVLVALLAACFSAGALAQNGLLWFSQGRPSAQAEQAIGVLEHAAADGLSPQDYSVQRLREQLARAASGAILPADAMARLDMALTASMQRYLADLHGGRLGAQRVSRLFKFTKTDDFNAPAYLDKAVAGNNLEAAARMAAPRLAQYDALRSALAQYRALAGHPAWQAALAPVPGNKLEAGQPYADLDVLTQRLAALGDVAPHTPVPQRYEGAIVDGVRAFQERHGLQPDGILGKATLSQLQMDPGQRLRQIELTLERLRWMHMDHASRMIVVNIPEFVLRAYEVHDGQPAVRAEMKIIVGRALDTRTPIFEEAMRFIEFSPYWNVPVSIVRAEILPRLRRDPAYFDQQGFEFVTAQGKVLTGLTGESLDALAAGGLRIRQRPGPRNALGDIKFIFPNDQNIYLHHTPAPQLFERYRRDFSHGCIRIEDPVGLAAFVLYDEPQWTPEQIRRAMGSGQSKTIRLAKPIPVLIAYNTVVVKDGKVYFFPDLYGHDAWLDKALRQGR